MVAPTLKLDPQARVAPLAPIALAKLVAAADPAQAPTLVFEDGVAPTLELPNAAPVEGYLHIIRELASHYASLGLSGADKDQSAQVNLYVSQGDNLLLADFQTATATADSLDQHLALRTFLVGHAITAADVAIWAAVRANSPVIGLVRKGLHKHLQRWFNHIDSLPPVSDAVVQLADAKAEKFKNKKTAAGFDLFLKDAQQGQVVTRFPPEPSGYLHVGHAKAAILNQYFARQYNGKLIIRFDDTNPSKEKEEFEQSIIEDLALLGIKGDVTSHTSDYFDKLYQLAIQMIQLGKAYADDTVQEQMRAERMDGIPSKRREASIEENMTRFAEMSTGSAEGRKWCLRAKISYEDPNKAMRDPVIYRCNPDVTHHRTGNTWKVYPTYDFACPIVDSIEGVTHALRTNEYRDRNPQYYWMLDALQLRKVDIWDFGRLNFVYTLLSKRKLQWFVDNGVVGGWDDPRFPTVRGIRRRGMTIETIQEFILAQGPSQQIINMEWDNIWTINKRIIDPVVPRYTALDKEGLVKVTVKGASPRHTKEVARHKKNAELGTKVTVFDDVVYVEQADARSFAAGEEVTFMDWGNVIIDSKEQDAAGNVSAISATAHLDGDFKKTKKKVTWLAASSSNDLVEIDLLDFDYLITKKKLEEDDNFADFVTPNSEFRAVALADNNVVSLKQGAAIQFERKGYYILDAVKGKEGRMEFIKIPDGKQASSASKVAPDEAVEAKKAAAQKARAEKAAAKAKKEAEKQERKAKKAMEHGDGVGFVAGKVGAGVAAATAGLAGAIAARKEDQAQASNPETSKASSHFPEIIDTGKGKINMYDAPVITTNIPTPVETKMYSMNKIL
ncbi:Glutamyl/glutaminyl-tRNA synthetase, class Ib, anti-codon binding domain protein [Kalmanozyma brasiliensis GHG001]|uniref:glutamate--tRNA ligase n=1 Tax=Kalmanozyma brasiliensis (strain GHG001) TaxID=1365824 RepID=V5ETQ1_KALBG|nr:Glutamyl/glutaminyl-tRNA synthetase, class Ib, anti-codon binding domain protein [Kalmanozyma brasiliensis GHG001]EST08650.1 Glutamyl/glutaminyl-tRNA synthetase, class Ib, anti-codon binding domain protein [Kalmanozyma brasiliensis GHG001]